MELLLNEDILKYYNQDIFAKTAVSILYQTVYANADFQKLFDAKKGVEEKYNHNIVVKNAISYLLYQLPQADLKKEVGKRKINVIKKLNSANRDLAKLGAKKIRPGSHVFVHSLNNEILETLTEAAKYKKFTINLVEHSPLGLGNALKKKLNNETIKVFPDLALKQAVLSSDTCILGAHSIIDKGSIVKLGSSIAAKYANLNHIPVYVAGHTWKYDHKNRTGYLLNHRHELDEHNSKKVYEYLIPEKITSYITEYGIFRPHQLRDEVRQHNKWMFV